MSQKSRKPRRKRQVLARASGWTPDWSLYNQASFLHQVTQLRLLDSVEDTGGADVQPPKGGRSLALHVLRKEMVNGLFLPLARLAGSSQPIKAQLTDHELFGVIWESLLPRLIKKWPGRKPTEFQRLSKLYREAGKGSSRYVLRAEDDRLVKQLSKLSILKGYRPLLQSPPFRSLAAFLFGRERLLRSAEEVLLTEAVAWACDRYITLYKTYSKSEEKVADITPKVKEYSEFVERVTVAGKLAHEILLSREHRVCRRNADWSRFKPKTRWRVYAFQILHSQGHRQHSTDVEKDIYYQIALEENPGLADAEPDEKERAQDAVKQSCLRIMSRPITALRPLQDFEYLPTYRIT